MKEISIYGQYERLPLSALNFSGKKSKENSYTENFVRPAESNHSSNDIKMTAWPF